MWFILLNLLQFAHPFSQGYNIINFREAETLMGTCNTVVGYQIQAITTEFSQGVHSMFKEKSFSKNLSWILEFLPNLWATLL